MGLSKCQASAEAGWIRPEVRHNRAQMFHYGATQGALAQSRTEYRASLGRLGSFLNIQRLLVIRHEDLRVGFHLPQGFAEGQRLSFLAMNDSHLS